jgi:excisionase family DNA binding protein
MKSAAPSDAGPLTVGNRRPTARHARAEIGRGPLLSVEEAASYLGVRPGTLRNWLSARRLAYVKVGRLTRLETDTLNRFIAEHTVDSIEDFEP